MAKKRIDDEEDFDSGFDNENEESSSEFVDEPDSD